MTRLSVLFLVALAAAGVPDPLQAGNPPFKRGDANNDGRLDIGDATHTLGHLFLGRPGSLGCEDAADSDDDGTVDLTDAVRSLEFLFLGATPPPPPFSRCGPDPSPDALRCAVFTACEPWSPGGEVSFSEAVSYAGYYLTTAVAFGDFNRDHALDLAYVDWGDRVSVRLGAGDGTLGEETHYVTYDGSRAYSLAIGDVNGDGALDLLVANSEGFREPWGTVAVFLGHGDGRFGEAAYYRLSTPGAFSIALGDLDGNGTLDVATSMMVLGEVSVLLGAGDGSFGEAASYQLGKDNFSIALGDLNRDGALDLAVANASDGEVLVLLGAGDGTFGKAVGYPAGAFTTSVAIGDLNGDGVLDLAAANGRGENVSILLGAGDGTFGEAVSYGVGDEPFSLALGDLNGDGVLDLAVANLTNDVSILLSR